MSQSRELERFLIKLQKTPVFLPIFRHFLMKQLIQTNNPAIYQIKRGLAASSDIITTDPPALVEDIYIRDGFANI